MAKYVALTSSDAFFLALCEAGVLKEEPSNVLHCVIDLQAGKPARILYETLADNDNLNADLVADIVATQLVCERGGRR